jgi:hypothetical protein
MMSGSLGQFGDARLDKGGAALVDRMTQRATCCLRQLSGDRGGEVQAGRFFANPKVTTAKSVSSWSEAPPAAVAMC